MNELSLNIKQNPGVIELNLMRLKRLWMRNWLNTKAQCLLKKVRLMPGKRWPVCGNSKRNLKLFAKNVKREWMKPYDDFEKRMKQLTAKIDEPINLINSQVEAFERKRKEERRSRIREIYQELIGDMEAYCELGRIYDLKWENATTTEKTIRESISSSVESARMAVNTISGMQSEAVEKALDIFRESMDMAKSCLLHQ